MKYLSLFSGIEAVTVAWSKLNWQCVAMAEIEKFPSRVLAHHYPGVPNLGDVTKITEQQIKNLGEIDLVVFGSPCQDLSQAGKRKGFDGERSSLTAIDIVRWARKHCGCRFALWENVPGAFSSNKGADFASVVEQMAGCRNITVPKYGWGSEGASLGDDGMLEWCTLDAQFFGLAQRRKRVFAIVDFGDWQSRPPILLEPESLRGDSPKGGKTRKDTATDSQNDPGSTGKTINKVYCGTANDYLRDLTLEKSPTLRSGGDGGAIRSAVFGVGGMTTNASIMEDKFPTILARTEADGYVCEQFTYGIQGNIIGRSEKSGGNGLGFKAEKAPTLTATDRHGVAYSIIADTTPKIAKEINGTLRSSGGIVPPSVTHMSRARYLTEIEAERLQGFPDNYTNIPGASKGARYKAIGNSMAVPVMLWIGQQIQAVFKYSDSEVA